MMASGFGITVLSTAGSGSSGSGNFAGYLGTAGLPGGPTVGAFTLDIGVVGASLLNFIIVDNNVYTLNVNFTFDSGTGIITMPFAWADGNVVTFTYKTP